MGLAQTGFCVPKLTFQALGDLVGLARVGFCVPKLAFQTLRDIAGLPQAGFCLQFVGFMGVRKPSVCPADLEAKGPWCGTGPQGLKPPQSQLSDLIWFLKQHIKTCLSYWNL